MKSFSNDVNAASLTQPAYICPCCKKEYRLSQIGGMYGLRPKDYDDIFFAAVCNDCSGVVTADTANPKRVRLKNTLEEYFRNPLGHPFDGVLALTSLKILEVHHGDIFKALELGWPFSKAMHHYHVLALDGGMVIVSEKEADHDA